VSPIKKTPVRLGSWQVWKIPSQGRHLSSVRAMLAWAVAEFSDATLTDLGTLLSRDVSTLSSAVRRLKVRALQD